MWMSCTICRQIRWRSRKLIHNPKVASLIRGMRDSLFDVLERTGGMSIPLQRKLGRQQNKRNPKKKNAADFPSELYRKQ